MSVKDVIFSIKVLMRKASFIIKKISTFLMVDMWNIDIDTLSKRKKRGVRMLKVLILMLKTFSAEKIGLQAKSLSYLCTMSIVPFAAVIFALSGGFGLDDIIREFLQENISNEPMFNMLTNAADNIIDTASTGLFGVISAGCFIWMVLWMMICVERVFNNVWRIKINRNFFKSFSVVTTILVLLPFVLVLFFSGSVVYSHILDLLVPNKIAFSNSIKSFFSWFIFCISAVLILSVMYKYIPNIKVKYRHAWWAAIFAGIVFTLLQYLYLETQVMVTRQSSVYGALAAIPLFMVWLNWGWTIVLYGAELSYALQNVEKRNLSDEVLDEKLRSIRKSGKNRTTDVTEIIN